MKKQLNEIKRMQQLAGIINESTLSQEEMLEEGFKEWLLAGLITLGTIAGGTKVYQMDKEAEADKAAQTEYYENILGKSLDKMDDTQKSELGDIINGKTKKLSLAPGSSMSSSDFSKALSNYADSYVKNHPSEFSVDAKDGSLHWKFEEAGTY
jgi:hypothetical protein